MPNKALIPLPAITDPTGTRCYQFSIPLDSEWLGMFFGALYQLTAWNSYDRDDDHTAQIVADRWKQILQDARDSTCGGAGGDDMNFRQRGCKLEYSIDCENWLTLYDPTACIADMIKGGEQGTGALQPGECKEYDVTLRANDKWLLPVPVSSNYIITVTDVSGAWNDGGSGGWNCPDGTPYILGQCFGSAGHASGDPSSSAYHMALIGILGGTDAVEVLGADYTVPDPTDPTTFELQANDSDITNNFGTISFHVKVCEGASVNFEHTWDFSGSDQGWSAFVYGGQALATYGSGAWFDNYPAARYDGIYIVSPLGNRSFVPVSISIHFTGDLNDNAIYAIADASDTTVYLNTTAGAGNPIEKDLTGIASLPGQLCIIVDDHPGSTVHSSVGIDSITISGAGPDPWA